ncbi:MAG: DUF1015 domain-containing protein [Clostridia bacterium]|nr:DUF1015 domain-containing protein [Clostridia bacterium]
MAEIKEFSALRFTNKAGNIADLCCPPYDIISDQEKLQYLNKNANNIIKLEAPEQTEAGYLGAKAELENRIKNGFMQKDDKECLYIYEQSFMVEGKQYSFKGFTAYVKLHEFFDGVILPHEHTLSKAKTDRLNLLNATGCSFSQIYSLYSDPESAVPRLLAELSEREPDVCFTDADKVTHRMWAVEKSEKTTEVIKEFADKKLYIADGHHRYETALNFKKQLEQNGQMTENANYIMMFLVDMQSSGLVVFPTHRIIKGLNDFNSQQMLQKINKYFNVAELADGTQFLKTAYQNGQKAFWYYDGNKDYALTLKDNTIMDNLFKNEGKALRNLDVSVLHSLILEGVLGIDKQNLANQINLKYTRSITEAKADVDGGANCCFIMNPTKVSEIAEVAAAGDVMPQKSTYFYPKLTTGLVINQIK